MELCTMNIFTVVVLERTLKILFDGDKNMQPKPSSPSNAQSSDVRNVVKL